MVKELLPVGKENAIESQALADLIGCKSVRELQQVIAAERANGAVIISSTTGGYYLPANKHEIREFIVTLNNRGSKTLAALESAKAALELEDIPEYS